MCDINVSTLEFSTPITTHTEVYQSNTGKTVKYDDIEQYITNGRLITQSPDPSRQQSSPYSYDNDYIGPDEINDAMMRTRSPRQPTNIQRMLFTSRSPIASPPSPARLRFHELLNTSTPPSPQDLDRIDGIESKTDEDQSVGPFLDLSTLIDDIDDIRHNSVDFDGYNEQTSDQDSDNSEQIG
jgi:hypothetical protein